MFAPLWFVLAAALVACDRPPDAVSDAGGVAVVASRRDVRVAEPRAPGGAARVAWQIDCGARDPCTCAEVGASVVEVSLRGRGERYDQPFECLQSLAVTGALRDDRYDVELRLETADGEPIGSARTTAVIDGERGEITDLGDLTIAIGG